MALTVLGLFESTQGESTQIKEDSKGAGAINTDRISTDGEFLKNNRRKQPISVLHLQMHAVKALIGSVGKKHVVSPRPF